MVAILAFRRETGTRSSRRFGEDACILLGEFGFLAYRITGDARRADVFRLAIGCVLAAVHAACRATDDTRR